MADSSRLILAEFITATAIVTWDEVVTNGRVPLPSRYLGAGLAFGILGLVAPVISDKLAATLGAGIILALLFQVVPGANADTTAGSTPEHNTPTTTRQDQGGGIVLPPTG